ncbi:MAG: DUF1684 domain-containing protein [Candidatus Eiseniibacteriota bacterium]
MRWIPWALAAVLLVTAAAASGKSAFWAEREKAYRESARGPFTAVHAEYVERGTEVLLFASEDSVWAGAAEDAPAANAGLRLELGADGFVVSPIEGLSAPAASGSLVRAAKTFGATADDAEDLRIGRWLLSLGMQGEDLGRVLVYDPRLLESFEGFSVFPESDAFRVEARVVDAGGAAVEVGTTRGLVKQLVRAAVLEFELGGARCRLTGFREPGDAADAALFVPYKDATSGSESYAVGRYLRVEPGADGTATVDFNHSTNPWCAYSPFWNCVLPPEENVLAVAVRAGERAPEGH